jgi:hypothetical protein
VAARHMADEQPLCCALHPSGFMAAIGSSEGLRLYYILRVSNQCIACAFNWLTCKMTARSLPVPLLQHCISL